MIKLVVGCSSNPCQNNGNCTLNNVGQITCACPATFTGNLCQTCKSIITFKGYFI